MRSAHAKATAPLPTHMVRASHVCGRRGENMKTLTLSIDCSDDDCFVISAITLGGNKAFEAEFDRDVRYGQVLYQMDEAVDGKFALVLGNGCSLAELRHDFRCKDIPGLVRASRRRDACHTSARYEKEAGQRCTATSQERQQKQK